MPPIDSPFNFEKKSGMFGLINLLRISEPEIDPDGKTLQIGGLKSQVVQRA